MPELVHHDNPLALHQRLGDAQHQLQIIMLIAPL